MNDQLRRKALIRKGIYFGVLLALFTLSMFWRGVFRLPVGNPESEPDRDASGKITQDVSALDQFARLPIKHQATTLELRELDLGDTEVAGSLAQVSLVGFRGLVVTWLWTSTINSQRRGEYDEMEKTASMLTRLQPHFIDPWVFQAWNISYNVSVETEKMGDMYYYIARGISFLAEGDRINSRKYRRGKEEYAVGSPDIRYQLGFYTQNKFTVADKVETLLCLSQLSLIPPAERNPDNLRDPATKKVDLVKFRDFCEKHPQLVRRMKKFEESPYSKQKEGLNLYTPEMVLQFLETNWRLPARYDVSKEGYPAWAEEKAFPVFPRTDPQSDPSLARYLTTLKAMEADATATGRDSLDIRRVARAWYEHAQAVIPPPKEGEPGSAPDPSDYDNYKYRIPQKPTLIVFRSAPSRSQAYVAERLRKEGWFDNEPPTKEWFDANAPELGRDAAARDAFVRWEVDAGSDPSRTWFLLGEPVAMRQKLAARGVKAEDTADLLAASSPKEVEQVLRRIGIPKESLKEGGELAVVPVRLRAGTSARAEWRATYDAWDTFGKRNSLRDPDDRSRLQELALSVEKAERKLGRQLPYNPTPEDLQAFGLEWRQANARKAVQFFEQNRQVTQYQKFYDESLAEQEQDLAASRQMFATADALKLENKPEELGVRVKAAAMWRRLLTTRHAVFYQSERADAFNEESLKHEMEIGKLLRRDNDPAVSERVAAARDTFAMLVPANAIMTFDPRNDPLLVPASEEEARIRIAISVADLDPATKVSEQAAADVKAYYGEKPIPPAALFSTARGLLERKYPWLVNGPQQSNPNFRWVRYQVRLERIMKESQVAAPSVDPPPGMPQAPTPQQPGGGPPR